MLLCLGLALLALFGFGDTPLPGLDMAAFAMAVAGAGISGVLLQGAAAKKRDLTPFKGVRPL